MSATLYETWIETPFEIIKTEDELLPDDFVARLETFRHNIAYYIHRIHNQWSGLLELREMDNAGPDSFDAVEGMLTSDFTRARYKVILTICQGDERLTLNGRERQQLDRAINKLYTLQESAHILLDLRRNVVYKSFSMTSAWMSNVVPKIIESDSYIDDDFVYTQQYFDEFIDAYLPFIQYLAFFHEHGTVALTDDHPAIQDWNLKASNQYPGLYHPNWNNSLLAPEISNFLLEAATGKTRFPVKLPNYVSVDLNKSVVVGQASYITTYQISATTYSQAAQEVRSLYKTSVV